MPIFNPEYDLEEKLIQAQNGEIPGEQFLREMMDMNVFLPILDKHHIGGFQESRETTPLSIKDEDGVDFVVLFTSPERAKEYEKNITAMMEDCWLCLNG